MRQLQRLYAWAFGYFWLPCPLCGEPFGGHEWKGPYQSIKKPGQGSQWSRVGVCPKCAGSPETRDFGS